MSPKDAADFDIASCAGFAVNAGTSVNFDGDVTKISGNVGVSPATAIQGNYEFTDSIYTLQVHTIVIMYAYKCT
jgi:phage gp45-like